RERGVDVVNLEARTLRDLGALRRLRALVDARGIEVIHAHLTYASIWGALVASRAGVPLVATLHTLPVRGRFWSRDRIRQTLMAWLLRRTAARVIAVSNAQAEAWIERGLLPRSKVAVVPNGVRIPPPGERRDLDRAGAVIGTAAVLREGKGIDVFLRALRKILDAEPKTVLAIAGDGPLAPQLRAEAETLGVAGSVRWLGYREDVPALLESFDLFVHPTLFDALPTSVLEAMAAGVPVVASATGGIPEIITDGRDGLLVPPGDEDALAAAVIRLLRHRSLLREISAAGRARVAAEFSAERWATALVEIYRDAAEAVR
ncbi:MAG TPA: glycosyltransferase family 4 protein, partial [Thermoanaerobaculia bacterium]|nr:glycosyltransferase family 4 protein [Thermoanaerobaculia bacterium]